MRRHWPVALFLGLVLTVPSWGGGEAKGLVLQVLVPQEDATISVSGKNVPGEGSKRRLEIGAPPAGKDYHTVTAVWEPNNYTKFTRTRKVPANSKGTVFVDLRTANNQEKIEIRYVPTPDD